MIDCLFLVFVFVLFFYKSLPQDLRQLFVLAISGNRCYDRESRCWNRNGIKDHPFLRHKAYLFARFLNSTCVPGALPSDPCFQLLQFLRLLLLLCFCSAPLPASVPHLIHLLGLLLGLPQGLLLATFASGHGTCLLFLRAFKNLTIAFKGWC